MTRQLVMLGLVLILHVSFVVRPSPPHSAEADETRTNASLEERLDTLERKMDALIEAVSDLRQGSMRDADTEKAPIEDKEERVQLLRNARDDVLATLQRSEEALAQLNAQADEIPKVIEVEFTELRELRELRRRTSRRLDALNELSARGDEVSEIVSLIRKAVQDADALESVANPTQLEATRDKLLRSLERLDHESARLSERIFEFKGAEENRRRVRREIERLEKQYQVLLKKLQDAEAQLD